MDTTTLKKAFYDRIEEHNASKEKQLEELAERVMERIYEIVLRGNLPLRRGINVCVEITSVSPDFSEFELYLREDGYDQESLEWLDELRSDMGFKLDHIREYWDGYTTYDELIHVCQCNSEINQELFKTCSYTMPHIADWEPLVRALEKMGFLIGFSVNAGDFTYIAEDEDPQKATDIDPWIAIAFELV